MERGTTDDLFEQVYDELRRLAGHLRRPRDVAHPTSLVHEAFLRMQGADTPWDQLHFRRVAAKAMRCVLVDRARRRASAKRGGGWQQVTLDGLGLQAVDVSDLADALDRLRAADDLAFQVVELRFFGGMSGDETASALDVSPRTVDRVWRRAKAFLTAALSE